MGKTIKKEHMHSLIWLQAEYEPESLTNKQLNYIDAIFSANDCQSGYFKQRRAEITISDLLGN